MDELTTKFCKACSEHKPLDQFHAHPKTLDRLNWRCIQCQRAYNAEYALQRTLAKCASEVLVRFAAAPMNLLRRFAPKVKPQPNGCWLWTANLHPDTGYSRMWLSRHDNKLGHRIAFEWARGPIPEGLVIDHLCRNRACVNPDHMEIVTNVENVMRGESVFAQNARKTHCLRGHPFDAENTYPVPTGGRACRECARQRKRERRRQPAPAA